MLKRSFGVAVLFAVALTVVSGSARALDFGQPYADTMLGALSVQRTFRNTLPSVMTYSQTAHAQNMYGAGELSSTDALGMAPVADSASLLGYSLGRQSNWVMWDAPWMMTDYYKSTSDYHQSTVNSSGFATGIGRLIGDTGQIGLAVGYDTRKQYSDRFDGHPDIDIEETGYYRANSDNFHAALYGGGAIGCFFVDGYAGYSRSWNRVGDAFNSGGPGSGLKTKYTDDVYSAGLSARYVWILSNNARIIPSVGVDYSHVRQNGFTVDNVDGSSALHADAANYDNVQVPLMVAANYTFQSRFLAFGGACSLWTPEVRAGWVPQFGSKNANFKYVEVDDASDFGESKSHKLEGSYGTVGAGLKIQIRNKYIFGIDYDYTFGKDRSKHVVTGEYGMSF